MLTRERLVYDNEKGKKVIVKEKINFSLNQSTAVREKEFHDRIKANLADKSAKLTKLGNQRHAEECTFHPTIIKKTKKKGTIKFNTIYFMTITFELNI